MTISFEENWDSGRLGATSADFVGTLRGTDEYVTALVESASFIPATFFNGINTLYLTNIGKIQRIAEEIWSVPFEYGSAQQAQSQQQEFASESDFNRSFDIGGGTAKVTHSLETVASYVPSGQTATNFKQAVGVTDTAIEGTDIVIPTGTFSETRNFVAEQYDSIVAIIESFIGVVNSTSFLGRAAGEVIYLGGSGGLKGNVFGEVTHKFGYSKNISGQAIGSISGITKRGHDYLWMRSKEEVDATTKRVALIPSQVNVERLYRYGDLNNIPNINNY